MRVTHIIISLPEFSHFLASVGMTLRVWVILALLASAGAGKRKSYPRPASSIYNSDGSVNLEYLKEIAARNEDPDDTGLRGFLGRTRRPPSGTRPPPRPRSDIPTSNDGNRLGIDDLDFILGDSRRTRPSTLAPCETPATPPPCPTSTSPESCQSCKEVADNLLKICSCPSLGLDSGGDNASSPAPELEFGGGRNGHLPYSE